MKNSSKASSSSSRPAKSSGGSSNMHKTTSSRAAHTATKQSSQRATASPASPKAQAKAKQDKVEFGGHAKKQLNDLGLHGKQRQEVERWHTRTVQREMNHMGADHAKIMYLAHKEGSKDNKPHITASLRTKDGERIKNNDGNLTHLYYDSKRVPPVYSGAVQKRDSS